jgi:hypothetical protein
MTLENKLASLMKKDPTLVRRVSDIEVEEITLTKKGAIGDEADAVLLFKESVEVDRTEEEEEVSLEKDDSVTEPEATVEAEPEVVELTKEEVEEPLPVSFDVAVSFLKKESLSDDQKNTIIDLALGFAGSADLEKESETSALPTTSDEVMQLLKSMNTAITKLAEKDTAVSVVAVTETVKESIPEKRSLLSEVGASLRKAQDERSAHGRAKQDSDFMDVISKLNMALSEVSQKMDVSKKNLNRACGQDA